MINIVDINYKNLSLNLFLQELSEFYSLADVLENNDWHHESVLQHTLDFLKEYEKYINEISEDGIILKNVVSKLLSEKIGGCLKLDLFKLVILFHDIGKREVIVLDASGKTSCPQHDEKSVEIATLLLPVFNISQEAQNYVLRMIKHHSRPHFLLDNLETCDSGFTDLRSYLGKDYIDLLFFCFLDTKVSRLKKNNQKSYLSRINFYSQAINNWINGPT